jgi:hypothetical protein
MGKRVGPQESSGLSSYFARTYVDANDPSAIGITVRRPSQPLKLPRGTACWLLATSLVIGGQCLHISVVSAGRHVFPPS